MMISSRPRFWAGCFWRKKMFNEIHHLAIIGSDYAKSKHFYVDLLGFTLIRENYRPDRGDYKLDLACGNQEIELFIRPEAPQRPSYPEALGLRHLAFRVADVAATVQPWRRRGLKRNRSGRFLYPRQNDLFFDPDGLPLEIHE